MIARLIAQMGFDIRASVQNAHDVDLSTMPAIEHARRLDTRLSVAPVEIGLATKERFFGQQRRRIECVRDVAVGLLGRPSDRCRAPDVFEVGLGFRPRPIISHPP